MTSWLTWLLSDKAKLVLKLAGGLLAVVAVIVALIYVAHLRDALSAAETARDVAQSNATFWESEYVEITERYHTLLAENHQTRARLAELSAIINALDLETTHEDPQGSADRLGNLNRRINGMLRDATRSEGADGTSAAADAGAD